MFGDESVASHLREHDYGKMFIKNNALWVCQPPQPLTRFLRQYFFEVATVFMINSKNRKLPDHNIDVIHKGTRGGSVRTRYYGQIDRVASPILSP